MSQKTRLLLVGGLVGIYITAMAPTAKAAATYCDNILTKRYVVDIPTKPVGIPSLSNSSILYYSSVGLHCEFSKLDYCKYKDLKDMGPGVSVTKAQGENRHVWYDIPETKYDDKRHVDVQLTPQDEDGKSVATVVVTGNTDDFGRPITWTTKYQLRKDCKIVGFFTEERYDSVRYLKKMTVSARICARLKNHQKAYEEYLKKDEETELKTEPPKSAVPSQETVDRIVKEVKGTFENMKTVDDWASVYQACHHLASDFGAPLPKGAPVGLPARKASSVGGQVTK